MDFQVEEIGLEECIKALEAFPDALASRVFW